MWRRTIAFAVANTVRLCAWSASSSPSSSSSLPPLVMGRRNARAPSVQPRRPQLNQLADALKTTTNKNAPAKHTQTARLHPLHSLLSPTAAAVLLTTALSVCLLIAAGEWALAAGLRSLFRAVVGSSAAPADLSLALSELDSPELLVAAVSLCRIAMAAIIAFVGGGACAMILIRREETKGRAVENAAVPAAAVLLCIGVMRAASSLLPVLPASMSLDLGWPSIDSPSSFSALAFDVAYWTVIGLCIALSFSSSAEARRLERLDEVEQRQQKRE